MLSAAVMLHHVAGTNSLSLLFGGDRASTTSLTAANATIIAVLLIVAVAGKSALLPFSSWLPRAMEGPTPSSAVYYGSLSVHAGCFLLLRAAPLLEQAPAARLLAGALGAATAVFAAFTTRAQSDVKSSLVHHRVPTPCGARLLPTSSVSERAERPPRPPWPRRDPRSARCSGSPRRGRSIGARAPMAVPDRARARVPRRGPRSCRDRAIQSSGTPTHPSRRVALQRRDSSTSARRRGGRSGWVKRVSGWPGSSHRPWW